MSLRRPGTPLKPVTFHTHTHTHDMAGYKPTAQMRQSEGKY